MLRLVDEKKYKKLRFLIEEMNSVDLAEYLEEISEDSRLMVLIRLMSKEQAAEVFAYLDSELQEKIVSSINDKELQGLLDELYLDDTVDFIEEMPASIVKRVIKLADPETRKQINQILLYPDDSAGAIMTTEYMIVKSEWTIARAITAVRSQCDEKESISDLFLTDSGRHLIGLIDLIDLLSAKDEDCVSSLIEKEVHSVNVFTDRAEVADLFKKYDLMTVPVVDSENRLVGLITIDDVVDVIETETTEDIYKMAAMQPIDESYSAASVLTLSKKRILWLSILMVSATLTGLIITRFETALKSSVVLTACIPMLMDTSGNAGQQASVSIIRALVLNEISFKNILAVLWKEFRVGLLVGLAVAFLNFLRLLIIYQELLVSIVVSVTLLCTIVCAKIVGCTLPLLASKLKMDPALMASPMITTIVDAVSLILYFGIATSVLSL